MLKRCTKGAFFCCHKFCLLDLELLNDKASNHHGAMQCNAAQQPSTTCFSPNVWWSSCKLSSQVFDESNMLLLLAMAMIPYPTNFKLTLTNVFFLLYPYCPNATQTSPNECHPNIPKTNATQTSPQNECHPNISSLDAWPLLYNSFATMMTKVERGSTHKRIPLYNGFFS